MERLPVTPLPPHRGRHAGVISVGMLAATTAVVWFSAGDPTPASDPRPMPVASVPREAPMPPVELGPDIKTVAVAERSVPRVIAATAPVTFDPRRTNYLRSPVPGVLVKARASSLGRTVRAGETVGVVYSLEVLATTARLLAELREFRNQEDVDRERMQLLRWGMRRERLAQIEQSNIPTAELPIIARVTGRVVVEEGEQRRLIDPGDGDVMTITDPTYAVIYLDLPVADADLLRVGQATRVVIGAGARPFNAPLGYLSSTAKDGAKIARVDLHPTRIKTPPAAWKDLLANVELARVVASGVAVPLTAVVRRHDRTFVYVARGNLAEAREVRLGVASEGHVLVESGLEIGELVVSQL